MKKIIIALLLFSSVSVHQLSAQDEVLDIVLNENYNCLGQLYIDILVKAADISSGDIDIGTSSIYIEYNQDALLYDRYFDESFNDETLNWFSQSFEVDQTYGLINITLHPESTGVGSYTLSKSSFLKIGTLEFEIVDGSADPNVAIKSLLTSFNRPSPNDGTNQIDVLNYDQIHGNVNIARSGEATQKSISGGWPAINAIDGSDATWMQCQLAPDNWWLLDLGYEADISYLTIEPRSTGTAHRMPDYVFVSSSYIGARTVAENLSNTSLGIFPSADPSPTTVTHEINQKARYILIMKEDEEYMAFKEVEVFTKTKNHIGGVANSSSVQGNFIASNGHDQNLNSRVETTSENESSWTYDMEDYYQIDSIIIYPYEVNPAKMPNNLFVSDYPYQFDDIANTTADGRVTSFSPPGTSSLPVVMPINTQGRYVRIQKSGVNNLIFRELKVFGCKLDCQPMNDLAYEVNRDCEGLGIGSIIFDFSTVESNVRTNIEFSIDGGVSFPYNNLLTDQSLSIDNLSAGTYDVWARWGDDDCPKKLDDIIVGTVSAPVFDVVKLNSCDADLAEGSISFNFPDNSGRTHIEFSLDGGQNYTTVSDTTVSYTFNNLPLGSYDVYVRWGNDECPIAHGVEVIAVDTAPTANSVKENSCLGFDNGTILFEFADDPNQTAIELSIDGGQNYVSVDDTQASYLFEDLVPGTYDLMIQWPNGACEVDMPDVVIGEHTLPSAILNSNAELCQGADGSINFSFNDDPSRTNIAFSIDGGLNYTSVPDDSGFYEFNGLSAGNYDTWVRWGDGDCAMDLGDIEIEDICSGVSGVLFLDGNQDGIKQLSEFPLKNIDVNIINSNAETINISTDENGYFNANVPEGLTQISYDESDSDFPVGATLLSGSNPNLVVVGTNEEKDLGDIPYIRCLDLDLEVLLEGAVFDAENSLYNTTMRTTMNEIGTLPGQVYVDPLFGSTYFPAGQPYSMAPFNYNGTEGDAFDSGGDQNNWDAGYPEDAVDWVLVSLRSDVDHADEVCRAAGLLLSDGSINLVEDFPCCDQIDNSFYAVVEHRNHLIVMSPTKLNVSNNTISFDFITNDSYSDSFGLGASQKLVTNTSNNNVYLMYAGNTDMTTSNLSDTDINVNDKVIWEYENNTTPAYLGSDMDLTGDVNVNDRLIFDRNNNTFSSVPR